MVTTKREPLEPQEHDALGERLRAWKPAYPLLLAYVAGITGLVLLFQIGHIYRYLAPDSFTYFTMARVFAEHSMLYSYSGLDHTTGIHPGYYFLLLPLYPLFGLMLPYWSFGINAALLLGGLYLCYRAFGPAVAIPMFALVHLVQGAASTNNGMESSLLFLALSASAYLIARLKARITDVQALMLGAALGLAVFARLDTIFFAAAAYGVLGIVLLVRRQTLGRIFRMYVFMSVPFLAILACALLLNLQYDGSLMPLSGKLKSSFPHLASGWIESLRILKVFIAAIAVMALYLIAKLVRKRPLGILVPSLFLSSALLFTYNLFFVSGIGAWYGALPFFALTLTSGFIVRDIFSPLGARLVQPVFFSGLVALSVLTILGHSARDLEDWITPHQVAAAYLRGQARPDEAAAEYKDGVFAFYAHMPVYSLTGLANDAAYVHALRTGTLAAYLKERHVAYVVGGSASSGAQVPGAVERLACADPFYAAGAVELFYTSSCPVIAQ